MDRTTRAVICSVSHLQISSGLGSGLAGSSGPFKFSVPSLQGQASGSSVTTATTSSDTSNDLDPGTVTNIKSDAPILLGAGRKKRSFDIFGNGNFHSNTFHPAGTFGNSGLYGNTGVFHHPRGTYGGHDGYGSSGSYGSVHPGDQNGNLYGGTATGYITYPGEIDVNAGGKKLSYGIFMIYNSARRRL